MHIYIYIYIYIYIKYGILEMSFSELTAWAMMLYICVDSSRARSKATVVYIVEYAVVRVLFIQVNMLL
jgi:hypothetical protein